METNKARAQNILENIRYVLAGNQNFESWLQLEQYVVRSLENLKEWPDA